MSAEWRDVRVRFRIDPALAEAEELPTLSADELDALMEPVGKEEADSLVIDAMARCRGFEGAHRPGDRRSNEGAE